MAGYRSIDETPLEATGQAGFEHGEAVEFAGSSMKTLGFFGRDLGSHAPTAGRVPAFLGLAERTGGRYVENPKSMHDALVQTGLDFEVRKEEGIRVHIAQPQVDGDNLVMQDVALDMPKWFGTVAYPNDGKPPFAIAPVGRYFKVVQNTEALGFGENIIDEGGQLVALGAYGDPMGSKTYAAFRLPNGMTVGGHDPYDIYLTITNAHDRTGGLTALTAPIRLGCTNQTYATFGRRNGKPKHVIRHTTRAALRVAEARKQLQLAFAYRDIFAEEAEKLLAMKMPKDQFVVYARMVFKTKDEADLSKMGATMLAKREDQLMAILASDTNEFGRGTAYAGYQALVEYADFFQPARGNAEASRQLRIMEGQTERFKNRAWEMATALA